MHLAFQQRFQSRAEAARVHHLDVLKRQILLQPVGHVEMAAGAHADCNRHVLEIRGCADGRVRPHENRPWRIAIGLRHEAPHPGAGIADAAPRAGALNHIAALGVRLVLRPLEIREILPARLRASESLPVKGDVEALGGEEAFLLRHEVVETHPLGRNGHLYRRFHLRSPFDLAALLRLAQLRMRGKPRHIEPVDDEANHGARCKRQRRPHVELLHREVDEQRPRQRPDD